MCSGEASDHGLQRVPHGHDGQVRGVHDAPDPGRGGEQPRGPAQVLQALLRQGQLQHGPVRLAELHQEVRKHHRHPQGNVAYSHSHAVLLYCWLHYLLLLVVLTN